MGKVINNIIEFLSKSLLVLMTLVVSWVVFSRFFLARTPAWGEELALLCMVWFGFLSMAIGVRDNLHLSVNIFDRFLSKSAQNVMDWFSRFLILGFGWFMVVEGIKMSQVAAGNTMPGTKLSSAVLYAAVPVGGIGIIYYLVTELFQTITRQKGEK